MIMAIEGARQVADPNEKISGYELRDCHLSTALVVPDTENGIEVVCLASELPCFSRLPESDAESRFRWYNFTHDVLGLRQLRRIPCRNSLSLLGRSTSMGGKYTAEALYLSHMNRKLRLR